MHEIPQNKKQQIDTKGNQIEKRHGYTLEELHKMGYYPRPLTKLEHKVGASIQPLYDGESPLDCIFYVMKKDIYYISRFPSEHKIEQKQKDDIIYLGTTKDKEEQTGN